MNLRAQLTAGFIAAIVLTVIVGVVSLVSQNRMVGAVQRLLERDNRIAELALESSVAIVKTRRAEKDFLLFQDELGFTEARARYRTLFLASLADIRQYMAEIRALTSDPDVVQQTQQIEEIISRYQAGYLKIVELYSLLNHAYTGLVARLQDKVHEIESLIKPGGPERLMIDLLTLRSVQRDFMARGLSKHVKAFAGGIERFKTDVALAALPPALKEKLGSLSDAYLDLFNQYVQTSARIDAENETYVPAAQIVEYLLEKLHLSAHQAAVETRERAEAAARTATGAVIGITLGALLIGLAVAWLVSRGITGSVKECAGFAERVARGDLTGRMTPRGDNEFGILAGALNRMTESLQDARAAQEGRTNELAKTNRALQAEIAERMLAEEALRLRDRAIEASVNAVIISDYTKPDNPIEYVNPAFERITGYSGAEALGRRGNFLQRDDRNQPGLEDLRAALREQREGHAVLRSYRKDGSLFWNDLYIAPVRNETGAVTHFVGIMNDITETKTYQEQLERQANYDTLTGLANRNLLADRLRQAVAHAHRHGHIVVVAFLDLDHFKVVNDSLGHNVGDELLKVVAQRLKSCVRESDTVARLGGDEFVLILPHQRDTEAVHGIAKRIHESISSDPRFLEMLQRMLDSVSQPVILTGRELNITCSIGLSVYPQDGEDVESLLKNADAAMYRAKELGRNNFQFYKAEMNVLIGERLSLQAMLRHALKREEFLLHYQPKVDLKSGRISGLEALIRWISPEMGLVPPIKFISILEETGMIIDVGRWVMEQAVAQHRRWRAKGLTPPRIAVNVSPIQLKQKDFAAVVETVLGTGGKEGGGLDLEITESLIMADIEENVRKLRAIEEMGIAIAIDDFGTGYSSLRYLAKLPVDALKIDRAFIISMAANADDMTIVSAIISLAHSLRLKVVAEGVETEEQQKLLRLLKCDEMQGYLFSPPVPVEKIEAMLAGRK